MLNFSVLGLRNRANVRLTATQVMNLRTTLPVIVTARAGHIIIPDYAIIRKPTTSSGWTIPSSTQLRLQNGSPNQNLLTFDVNTANWGAGNAYDGVAEFIAHSTGFHSSFTFTPENQITRTIITNTIPIGEPLVFKNTHASTEISNVVDDSNGFALYLSVYYKHVPIGPW
jgi:hypothetical protein